MRIPLDSADAREQREAEAEADGVGVGTADAHPADCRGGWLGEDAKGRPRPCLACRPHLAHGACRSCSSPWASCQSLRLTGKGPCCLTCNHHPAPTEGRG